MAVEPVVREESLDPENWDALRALGHRMVDDMLSYLQTVRDGPVWRPMPEEVKQAFAAPLPLDEQPAEAVYAEFVDKVLAYPMGNIHPRFWGWVMGNGTPLAMLAEMLAAGVNPNMGGGDHVGPRVEMQVIEWCKQMLGYAPAASGLLVSGGSMANLVGLTVARWAKAGFDVREEGLQGTARPLTMYGSVEMHSSLQRAAEALGIGNRYLRRIPVDDNYRINVTALRRAIAQDKADGLHPIAIIGNAGTVNTAAIDPLDTLADVAAEHGLWYHVDGAFGALAYLSPELRPLLKGMERADSLAFDLHKWVYLPFEVGCVLVRDEDAHRRTFSLHPDYLKVAERGLASGPFWYGDYGIQLSRGFRALKVWMTLKAFGIRKMGRLIQQNVEQARHLAGLVRHAPRLELVAPVALNIVCFRYVPEGWTDEERLNAFNEELLLRLQESGTAIVSGTYLRGRYALRPAITNHRSRREDFDLLVAAVLRIGDALVAEGWR